MPAGISRLSLVLGALFAACAMGETNGGINAYSMLTHDGRRLVSHVEGTNTVFELVHTNALPRARGASVTGHGEPAPCTGRGVHALQRD